MQRNFANPAFCPVLTMLHWLGTLKMNGIDDGPLFPALNKAHDDFLRKEVDGVVHLQRMTAATFGKWTREGFRVRAASSGVMYSPIHPQGFRQVGRSLWWEGARHQSRRSLEDDVEEVRTVLG